MDWKSALRNLPILGKKLGEETGGLTGMKMVVGLGNPGREYQNTRHNAGFDVLDELARRHGGSFRSGLRFKAESAEVRLGGSNVLLVKPTTYMNASGDAVGPLMRKRGIAASDVLVVVDDVDLDLGRLRIRGKGSPGGHNGLKSLQAAIGSDEYARVRVGVGRPKPQGEMVGHVLSRFAPDEKAAAADLYKRAADAVEMWLGEGLVKAMNSFNG